MATPLTADSVSSPSSVPLAGLAASSTVTLAVEPVGLSKASRMDTCMPGFSSTPAVPLAGWRETTSFAASAAVMSNVLLVTAVRSPEVACSV